MVTQHCGFYLRNGYGRDVVMRVPLMFKVSSVNLSAVYWYTQTNCTWLTIFTSSSCLVSSDSLSHFLHVL